MYSLLRVYMNVDLDMDADEEMLIWCDFFQTEYWIGLKIININEGFKKFF